MRPGFNKDMFLINCLAAALTTTFVLKLRQMFLLQDEDFQYACRVQVGMD
jgi:hypothetical protein